MASSLNGPDGTGPGLGDLCGSGGLTGRAGSGLCVLGLGGLSL